MGKPTYDELKSLYDDMEKQKIENEFIVEELYNRINDSIKYIEHHKVKCAYSPRFNEIYYDLDDDFDVLILLNMLRGKK